jgi:predicted enzyme related to lactoylglutathione lyase
LGAVILDDRRNATPGGWIVMADPEGNEFCLEQGE